MKNITRFSLFLCFLIYAISVHVYAQNKLVKHDQTFGDSYLKLEIRGNTNKEPLSFKLTLTSNLTSYYDINIPILGNADTLLKIPSFKLTAAILKVDSMERYIFLQPHDTTRLVFNFKPDAAPEIQYNGPYEAIFRETKVIQNLFTGLFYDDKPSNEYVYEPNHYRDRALSSMREKIDKINSAPLSEDSKISLHRTFAAVYARMFLLDPNNGMYVDNVNAGMDKNKAKIKNKINLDYYTFLKDLDLNNKDYLLSNYYNELTKSLLADSVLNLPTTDHISLQDWMNTTTTILNPLLGYSDGYFYDIMLANAYLDQIARNKFLSDKQSKEIIEYFKDTSFSDYILYQNSINTLRIVQDTGRVYDWSHLEKGDVLSEIVKRYPAKALVIDFWATWCGPCISAMDKIKPVKEKYRDVIFVYIADVSSPRTLWNNQVKGIAGNHYYLSSAQMEKIQKQMDFSSLPTYLIYNKQGELKNHIVGFPGPEKFDEILGNLEK